MKTPVSITIAFIGSSALLWSYHSIGLAVASFCFATALILACDTSP